MNRPTKKSSATKAKEVVTVDLDLIEDLVDSLCFDFDNCDFGPAYSAAIERKDSALKKCVSCDSGQKG